MVYGFLGVVGLGLSCIVGASLIAGTYVPAPQGPDPELVTKTRRVNKLLFTAAILITTGGVGTWVLASGVLGQ